MDYIHNKNIYHRDLKLENIMVKLNGQKVEECLLIDFGFAIKVNDSYKEKNLCGTLNYMAPEIFERNVKHGSQIDIWALGVILYKLVTDEFPFHVFKSIKPE